PAAACAAVSTRILECGDSAFVLSSNHLLQFAKHLSILVIITRSPLRVPLGGGGTDLPSYYSNYGGFFLSAAIDKYVYITIHRRFVDGFLLKYSKLEEVSSVAGIQHPIIR